MSLKDRHLLHLFLKPPLCLAVVLPVAQLNYAPQGKGPAFVPNFLPAGFTGHPAVWIRNNLFVTLQPMATLHPPVSVAASRSV